MKKFLALALSCALAFSLAACGGTADTGDSSSSGSGAAASSGDSASTEEGEGGYKPLTDDEISGFAPTSSWAPSGTVSIIVPAGAGGNTDLSARVFAYYAGQLSGATFIVVNANGASGSVAADQVLGSAADGMTFLYGHALVNVANIAGVTDYNYTAFKLGPTFAKDPAQQLYVSAEKYADLDAFIEAAKAAPGQLQAVTEVGAYTYYELLEFEKQAGIDLALVDGGSNSEKIAGMLGGQYDLMPGAYINCKDYLASGEFNVLGVPSEERFDLIPDIPTFKEQGIDLVYPDCDFSFYFPADTSDDVITYYENLVEYMLTIPTVQDAVAGVDMMPYYLTAAESAENEEWMYNTIKAIADSVEG